MALAREHIEEIRRKTFGIGESTPNPLAGSLHQAIIHLSAELYQKDVHFISELIQNAEDNTYAGGVEPALELVLTQEDVAQVGAPATLLLFNNEQGFKPRHVSALCAVGNSTKKGQRNDGYIGEKGIGFKSVFLVSSTPYIVSNGYRIRFSDKESSANIAYIVPEWVATPTDGNLRRLHGGKLPTTTIVLPLRADKVAAVQKELKQLSPETIMFLKRMTHLRIRDETGSKLIELNIKRSDSPRVTVANDIDTECFTASLSVISKPDNVSVECKYYISEQKFTVTASVEQRKEVKTWTITLAFPYQNRPSGHTSGDIYAFLPSQIKSELPFIINADFLLVSSRETLRFDSPWNCGILACVPEAFLKVMRLLRDQRSSGADMITVSDAPTISVQHFYRYIPVNPIQQREFDIIRRTIVETLKSENIVLVDANLGHQISSNGIFFCMPSLGRQITEKFRSILKKAYMQGAIPPSLICSSWYIVDGVVQRTYPDVLDQLGVPPMSWREYLTIVRDFHWIMKLTEDLYLEVVEFVIFDLHRIPPTTDLCRRQADLVPLLKYQKENGSCSLATMSEVKTEKKFKIYTSPPEQGNWLSEWIYKFKPWVTAYFMPANTFMVMQETYRRLKDWLVNAALISELSVQGYAEQLMDKLPSSSDPAFVLLVWRVLHDSIKGRYFDVRFVSKYVHGLSNVPVVDESGNLEFPGGQTKILLPRQGSTWPILLGDKTLRSRIRIVRMSDDYLNNCLSNPADVNNCLSNPADMEVCKKFLSEVFGATDLPELVPEDVPLPTSVLSRQMTKEQSVCLLQWLHYLVQKEVRLEKFFSSIKNSAWIMTQRYGIRCPKGCFLPTDELTKFFRSGDVAFLDKSFYGNDILRSLKYTLEHIGVIIKVGAGCDTVAEQLLEMAAGSGTMVQSSLEQVISLYTYLEKFHWKPTSDTTVKMKIFISVGAQWKSAKECVIQDEHKLFNGTLPVLEDLYPKNLLPFFRSVLEVPRKPHAVQYCELWLKWSKNVSSPNSEQCGILWREISKNWKSCKPSLWQAFKAKALVLSTKNGHDVFHLSPPGYTFIPDNLDMQNSFTSCSEAPSFVWYPKGSESFESQLNEVYAEMGVKELSACVETRFNFSAGFQRKLLPEEGLVSRGLLIAILGFLSKQTAVSFSSRERQEMVMPLSLAVEVEIDSPFERSYSLSSPSFPQNLVVKQNAMAYWDKTTGKLFRLNKNHMLLESPLGKREFETQFAETIANGILSQYSTIAKTLVDFLRLMIDSGFEESVVEYELRRKNIRIYEQDSEFVRLAR